MRIDLHTHAKWSKEIDFSLSYYEEMMAAASRNGLHAVALTEHFNTKRFPELYRELDRHCAYADDYYVMNGIRVIPGMEVDVKEGAHILLIGGRERIIEVRQRLEGHTASGHYIGTAELLDLADEYDCLRIGAHPYREENPLTRVPESLLPRFDALDLNGRDLHHSGMTMEAMVRRLAEQTGLPVVAGSDTHHPLQFGSLYNELAYSCDTVAELRAALRNGDFRYRLSEQLDAKVRSAEEEQRKYKRQLRAARR